MSEKQKEAKEDYEETKKAYDEARKMSPEWQEKKMRQYLDRFSNRLKGLNEKQRKEVVSKSLKTIIEKGGLKYDEFKTYIAEAIGLKDLTPEEIRRMEELTNKINGIDGAIQKFLNDPTKENLKAVEDARREAMLAGQELKNMTFRPSNWSGFLNSTITGSLLTPITSIMNVIQNIVTQATVRFPTALYRQAGESTVFTLSLIGNKLFGSKIIYPTKNIILAQKGYYGKGQLGINRAWFNFYKGTQERDYFGKTSYASAIDPREAVKDIKLWKAGEKYFTKEEIAERFGRATIGWQADFILRTMSFGDKPFRWAAEGAEAIQIATTELKLTTNKEIDAFMLAPKEYTIKVLKQRGVPSAEAEAIGAEYETRILRSGSRATYEQENILSYLSKSIDKQLLSAQKSDTYGIKFLKGLGSVVKTAQFPFVKIPANIYWQYYKVANPIVSFGQALFHSGEAAYYAKKGDAAGYRRATEDFKDNMALFAYGLSIRTAVAGLAASNLVRPPDEDEVGPRERSGTALYGRPDRIDVGTLMGGEPYFIDLKWFGPLGTSISVEAALYRKRKQEELKGKQREQTIASDITDRLGEGAAKALDNLIMNQATDIINAIRNGDADANYFVSKNLGTINNMFTGSTLTAISKAQLPYEPRLKADGLMQEISNNMKYRNILYRFAAGMPPQQVSIWGEKIKRDNSFWGVTERLLGFAPQDANQFGLLLYNDFLRTKDPRFFPMPEDNRFTVNGEDVELTKEQQAALQTYVGKARKALVSAFVYDSTQEFKYTDKDNKTHKEVFSKLPDEEKVKALQKIYEYGKQIGITQFKTEFPAFADAKVTGKEMAINIKNNVWNMLLKLKMRQEVQAKGGKAPDLTKEEQEFLDEMKASENYQPPTTSQNNEDEDSED